MNTIWYDNICILHLKFITFSWEVKDPGGGLPFSKIGLTISGCLPCQHDKPSWQQSGSALCHLHGQVGVAFSQTLKLSFYHFPLSSAGAPPGANGHPVPITYEGFTLLTDNYNNFFMSSFTPQVKIIWKSEFYKNLLPCTVQLLPVPGLSDQPVPTEALFWLDASRQTFLEVDVSSA